MPQHAIVKHSADQQSVKTGVQKTTAHSRHASAKKIRKIRQPRPKKKKKKRAKKEKNTHRQREHLNRTRHRIASIG